MNVFKVVLDFMGMWLVAFVCVYLLSDLIWPILYKRPCWLFGFKRSLFRKNTQRISMVLSPLAFLMVLKEKKNNKRFFAKELKKLFDSLEKGNVYMIHTHQIIKNHLEQQVGKGEAEIISIEAKRERTLFLEKLFILNFNNLFEKRESFLITFKVI